MENFASFYDMSTEIKSCYIYSDDNSRPAILLPDEKPLIIGRNPETKITDSKCSRNQVRLCASYADKTVSVQQIGNRCSGLNGFKLDKGVKVVARHGDHLEILYGCYNYRIEFNPAPTSLLTSNEKRIEESHSDNGSETDFEPDGDNVDKQNSKARGNKRTSDEGLSPRSGDDNVEETSVSRSRKRPKVESGPKESSTECNGEKMEDTDTSKCKLSDEKLEEDYKNEKNCITECWEELGTLMIYTSSGVESRKKIAAYDMDNTLIKTRSGLVFPKDQNDWELLYPEVPGKLKKLYNNGYKIVIFTNQGGMFLGKVKPSDFKLKIERVVKKLGIPVQVFIATGKDLYRKPRTGMWEKLINDKNDAIPVDKMNSFFVGDAAGRPKDWAPKKKKDHSSADRLMALNLDLTFYTPEEHFLCHKPAAHILPEFNPKNTLKSLPLYEPKNTSLTSSKQEVILMVGSPGSGKSHVARTHLKNYYYINRDKLGSWQKCVAALENALAEGESVVVDNTNPDVASRQRYINVAKAQGVPVRCFVMTTDKEHARHNNKFRELTDPSHMTVTDVIINSYSYTNSTLLWRCTRFLKLLLLLCLRLLAGTLFNNVQPYRKLYVPPKREEGFVEIVKINCVPRFTNKEHQKLYEMYLLEK